MSVTIRGIPNLWFVLSTRRVMVHDRRCRILQLGTLRSKNEPLRLDDLERPGPKH